jgi:hypothetical protein
MEEQRHHGRQGLMVSALGLDSKATSLIYSPRNNAGSIARGTAVIEV